MVSNYMKDHKDEFKPPPNKPKPKKEEKSLRNFGCQPRASQTEIKKLPTACARDTQTKYPGAKDEFQEKFIEIANAYEILSNEKKRRRYDQTGLMGDEEEDMDDDEFGGFDSFDEAWSAFGDMGEAPPDVQPDVDDTLTSWLLFFTLGMFIFAPLGVQFYKAKNKNKKCPSFCEDSKLVPWIKPPVAAGACPRAGRVGHRRKQTFGPRPPQWGNENFQRRKRCPVSKR